MSALKPIATASSSLRTIGEVTHSPVLPNALLGWWSSTSIVRYESAAATSCDEIIISGYDKQVAFQNYHTFAIDPSVHVPTASADGSISAAKLDAASATLVMAEVGASMTHMGYKHVDPHARPDLGITVTGINIDTDSVLSGWWTYGDFWGHPGAYYYPYYHSYNHRRGSLLIEMVVLILPSGAYPALGVRERSLGLPVIWSSVAFEVLDSSGQLDLTLAVQAVRLAFKQSPYLRK